MKNIPCCALVCLPCVCMSVYACRILEGFIDFVLDISLLWNMFHFVCVLFWRASHAKALPSSRRLAKILSLSLSLSLFLWILFRNKKNVHGIANASTTFQRQVSPSVGRKTTKMFTTFVDGSSAAKQNLSHRHTTKFAKFSSSSSSFCWLWK